MVLLPYLELVGADFVEVDVRMFENLAPAQKKLQLPGTKNHRDWWKNVMSYDLRPLGIF